MTPLEVLRRQLQIHNRDSDNMPPSSRDEARRREFQRLIILLQIECEEWRLQARTCFYMCSLKVVSERIENLELQSTKTVFNWEPVRDAHLQAINEKEQNGMRYLQELIQHTYMTNKQRFETGLRFTLPDSEIVYKQIADHYGKDYIAYLNNGQWQFSIHIVNFRETGVICNNGKEDFELAFDNMAFVNL